MLLFAIAAVCLVALVLRRRPQQAAPTNAPETDTQAAHVIELQRHRRSA
jgi:hypothetical protein